MTSLAVPDPSVEIAHLDTWQLRRRSQDLYARALVGPVFYVMAWLLILSVSDTVHRWGWAAGAPVLVFAAFWWARSRHRLPPDDAPSEAFTRWTREHWLLISAGSLAWGAVPAFVGWEAKLDNVVLVTALSTMAFCTATSQSFAMHPWPARASIVLLMLPGVVVFVWPGSELRSTGVTLFLYSLYLLANLRRSAAEYARQLDTELALLRSRAEVAKLSLTDPLTGLANRRHYELVWERVASAAQRQQSPLAVVMLDLDHFKRVNDDHGHPCGDACLRHFAELLRQHFRRDADFLARLGGEEFVVVLPGVTAASALEFSEQLRGAVAANPCLYEGRSISLTVSGGVAEGVETTFERADAACYAAKAAGRNRVEAWRPELQRSATS
jgi:diguanylate cyclase (GGDEF)-like protein